ncbi:MAG: ABC transporter ATP-binding protein [Planctomycetes bacterium]|nr:ABC transporter ATP-binding protein [Planctomycetota bacterium]
MNATAAKGETLIELVGVRKRYRFGEAAVNALDGVDLRVAKGSFVGVIGRSGSGKSTFLNVVGGLDRPSEGSVLVQGRALMGRTSDELAAYRRQVIGFIFQSFNLVPHLTALENVALPLALAGQGYFERRRRAQELLDKVGLGARTGHRPTELSGGERQRVAIARALSNDPQLLLADEPTGNLDSRTAEEIMGMLRALHAEGCTIVLVTHDRERAERYCERIVVLEDGRVKEDRTTSAALVDLSAASVEAAPPAEGA